ncbi:MAG TPA: hypothetical protein VK811_00905, partial [Candidatus Acidoferrum sp.]|nr:hypothetical protein [Candidatus Acidoferrum sp.]
RVGKVMKSPESCPCTSFLSKRLGKKRTDGAIIRTAPAVAITGTVMSCENKKDETFFCERCP